MIKSIEPSFSQDVWSECPNALEFVKACLIKDFRKRPDCEKMLNHKWLDIGKSDKDVSK